MAELDTACCMPEAQETCCEPHEETECCRSGRACGCGAAIEPAAIREAVRERYVAAARAVAERAARRRAGAEVLLQHERRAHRRGGPGRSSEEHSTTRRGRRGAAGRGRRVPRMRSADRCGRSGQGRDGARPRFGRRDRRPHLERRVGPTGRAIGLDMTDEMLALARRNAEEVGAEHAEFVKGHIEDIPLPDNSVDVVISNCVINLSGDKPKVLREAARVLRPGDASRSATWSPTRTWTRPRVRT